MANIGRHLVWLVIAVAGAFALATIALGRGEAVSALWIVVAAVCVYLIAYRFYSLFIATRVLRLDAQPHDAGRDATTTASTTCRPTSTCCSATTSPPSPAPARWSGPVLAAQMGYLPGHAVDPGRRGVRRRGAGLHGPVHLDAPRRPLARRHDQAGDGPGAGHDRAVRHLHDHDHHAGGAGADRGQGAGRMPVGHLHRRGDDPDRAVHGRLPALPPARAASARCR